MNPILERRSVRQYTEEPVTKEQLNDLVKAGMYAPSSHNTRPWEFIVVTDKKMLEKLSEASPYAKTPLNSAKSAIVVLANTKNLKTLDFLEQNLAACTQNILLEAKNQNLGTCWIGIMPKEDCMKNITDLFNLPVHILPFNIIAVGHPKVETTADRFDQERIHDETY